MLVFHQRAGSPPIRGEHKELNIKQKEKEGSPPHTWRTLIFQRIAKLNIRITSTYVENTFFRYLRVLLVEDHLHIRGEHQERGLTNGR